MPLKDRELRNAYYVARRKRPGVKEADYAKNEVARQKRLLGVRTLIYSHLVSNPCVDCGESDPIVLDFDHSAGEKQFEIGAVASGLKRVSAVALAEEMSKCVIRCANCHRKVTAQRSKSWRYGFNSNGSE